MIEISCVQTYGWEAAVRGMRNPMNSWDKSDSFSRTHYNYAADDREYAFLLGINDTKLMQKLIKAGPDHAKFLRMIGISMDILAPLYWWKEFDTYKVGTTANSCSTMHKIAAKEFTIDDFSHEHLFEANLHILEDIVGVLNRERICFVNGVKPSVDKPGLPPMNKEYWWQMIQLLPSSYNQKRTVTLNYEVARRQYHARKNHKQDEWSEGYCKALEQLPYAKELIME